jgi:hypothetical protein
VDPPNPAAARAVIAATVPAETGVPNIWPVAVAEPDLRGAVEARPTAHSPHTPAVRGAVPRPGR